MSRRVNVYCAEEVLLKFAAALNPVDEDAVDIRLVTASGGDPSVMADALSEDPRAAAIVVTTEHLNLAEWEAIYEQFHDPAVDRFYSLEFEATRPEVATRVLRSVIAIAALDVEEVAEASLHAGESPAPGPPDSPAPDPESLTEAPRTPRLVASGPINGFGAPDPSAADWRLPNEPPAAPLGRTSARESSPDLEAGLELDIDLDEGEGVSVVAPTPADEPPVVRDEAGSDATSPRPPTATPAPEIVAPGPAPRSRRPLVLLVGLIVLGGVVAVAVVSRQGSDVGAPAVGSNPAGGDIQPASPASAQAPDSTEPQTPAEPLDSATGAGGESDTGESTEAGDDAGTEDAALVGEVEPIDDGDAVEPDEPTFELNREDDAAVTDGRALALRAAIAEGALVEHEGMAVLADKKESNWNAAARKCARAYIGGMLIRMRLATMDELRSLAKARLLPRRGAYWTGKFVRDDSGSKSRAKAYEWPSAKRLILPKSDSDVRSVCVRRLD